MTHIREATEADVEGIAAIYAPQTRDGYATFETEPPPRQRWLDKLASTDVGDHVLVAVEGGDQDGRVLGYAYSTTYRPRAAYGRTRETSVYLADDATGRGLGRALYDDLLPRLRADGVHTALAGIARPNAASEALHRAVGFEPIGVMREVGHKFGRWIDVGWWQLML